MKIFEKLKKYIDLFLLILILYFAVSIRMKTVNDQYVQTMADPYYFLRVSEDIIKNGYLPPKWDSLSHAIPGRFFFPWIGWTYFIVIIYVILNFFGSFNVMYATNLAPVVMSVFTGLFAYLIGRFFSNKWAGLITAVFVLFSPTFVSVSSGGYADSDAIVVTYFLMCTFSLFLAYKKQKVWVYVFTIITNAIFIISWNTGYFPLFMVSGFLSLFLLWDIFKRNYGDAKQKFKFIAIVLIGSILLALPRINVFKDIYERIRWFGGEMLVTISVAELMPIKPTESCNALCVLSGIAERIGFYPFLISTVGLASFFIIKLYKKKKILKEEFYLLMWLIFMFFLVTRGTRFVLLLLVPVTVIAGYLAGRLIEYVMEFKDNREVFISLVVGSILFICITMINIASNYVIDIPPSNNWLDAMNWLKANTDKDALVVTWWDPGHFITETTGLRVHADGAHCPPGECIPYNHNDRIRDMGFIFSTDSEEDAINVMKKYVNLTDEQKNEVKEAFPYVPDDAFRTVSEIYYIASSDLLGKYTWLGYFGGFSHEMKVLDNKYMMPGQCYVEAKDTYVDCPWVLSLVQQSEDVLIYSYGEATFALVIKNNTVIPIYMNEYIINELVVGDRRGNYSDYETSLSKLDGMLWVDTSLNYAVYFSKEIKNNIFTRTFFFSGEGLEKFKLVYFNSEIRMYKIEFR